MSDQISVSLGVCYSDGTGVDKDEVEAVKWYLKAAAKGDAVAQFNLGVRYYKGEGVEESTVEAYAWLNLASKKDKKAGALRDDIEKQMSPHQVGDAQKRTKELLTKQLLAQEAELTEQLERLKELRRAASEKGQ